VKSCPHRRWVEEHFDGTILVHDERVLRRHLPGCEECRFLYQRLLVGARLDPKALSPEERLARGLGLRRSRPRRWVAIAAASVALTAAVLLFAKRPAHHCFVSRVASVVDKSEILVYRAGGARTAERIAAGAHISATSELAFAYRNPEGFARLCLFAVDEHRHVYWYYPAVTDPASEANAIAIRRSTTPIELNDAVAHPLDGAELRLYALFLRSTVSVRQIEEMVQARREDEWVPTGGRKLTIPLVVEHALSR
jgi:hypothetical protein